MNGLGNKEIFSANLLYFIEKSGKSQKDIAEVVGVSTSAFNEWVKGKKYPRIDKIEKLANFFRVQKSDLIENREKNNSTDDALTDGERQLLELFNRVPEERRQMILEMIKAALKTK